jgi:signal transduction histidine kinase
VVAPTGLTIQGNQHWLDLALSNPVSNALKHGKGTIRITATEAAGRTQLAVSDEGPGFPADFVDYAFDRFSRADTSRTTRGTGLGLALVQAVAEAHGGTGAIAPAQVVLNLPTRRPPT